ncbi:hypothetical protein R6Q59_010491 [Mikania micrantha]|uniref:Transcription repressor n=1 Tax=Mikania micrantha TaxID=192012 RepID=A0A5N6N5L3_9ASTR|nr:hypothetical protein E3N88_25738 [Mikania micrantha]
MFDFKISLSSFRLCRRKTKSLATTRFFSPVNPKVREITYPSPPPTTPTHLPQQYPAHRAGFKEGEILTNLTSISQSFSNDKEPIDSSRKEVLLLASSEGGAYRKVMKETQTLVRWSKHPYDDFKTSMLEMILEKKMFEAKELEMLLQCFLILNHKNHHDDIVAAFTEIWNLLFR